MTAKRKLAVILSADAAGYSRLMAADDTQTLRALNELRAVYRDRAKAHGGIVIDTAGDSILAEFSSPVEAVRCALDIQNDLSVRTRSSQTSAGCYSVSVLTWVTSLPRTAGYTATG